MRTNLPAADELIGLYFPMLDGKGFVALTDYMGSDESIENAARTSYLKGTRRVSDTRNLLRRLMRDKHTSPFEFAELQFHVRAPLYVIQQWLRHRTNNFCQESHRFSEVRTDFQTTQGNAWRLQDTDNKQGSSGLLNPNTFDQGEYGGEDLSIRESLLHKHARDEYNTRIRRGVSREQARKDILVSTYSTLCVKSDLHNLLHFLRLRTAPDAQLEIRAYANIIAGVVKRVFPLVWEAFTDYNLCSRSFSRLELDFLSLISVYSGTWEEKRKEYELYTGFAMLERANLSKREYREFWNKLSTPIVPNFELDLSTAKTAEEMENGTKTKNSLEKTKEGE